MHLKIIAFFMFTGWVLIFFRLKFLQHTKYRWLKHITLSKATFVVTKGVKEHL